LACKAVGSCGIIYLLTTEIQLAEKTKPTQRLYAWNWTSGGYNQCYAFSKAEARKKGNAICDLVINEDTFRLVRDEKSFWDNYPIFD